MQDLRQRLAPLTDWIPDEIRAYAPIEIWWLAWLVVALLALLIVGKVLKAIVAPLFRRRPKIKWDEDLREDLNACPMPGGQPMLAVHHQPASVRLVIVAPAGKGIVVQAPVVAALLDRLVPGLGEVVQRDRPRIRVWPAPKSREGFRNTFHRCTPTGEAAGESSNWVLLAGKAQAGTVPLFVGLALWTEQPTNLGRLNLDEDEWRRAVWRLDEKRHE